MNIKIKQVVKYNGHSLSANGSVNLDLKAAYDELGSTIQVFQLLNNDVKIKARIAGAKPMNLGMFRLKQITIDGDGESKIRFNGLNDYIEMDNLNLLPLNSDDAQKFIVMYEAEIEEEGENEE